jgi:hypothetical protein
MHTSLHWQGDRSRSAQSDRYTPAARGVWPVPRRHVPAPQDVTGAGTRMPGPMDVTTETDVARPQSARVQNLGVAIKDQFPTCKLGNENASAAKHTRVRASGGLDG